MGDDLRELLRTADTVLTSRHFSPRTRGTYLQWIRRYGTWAGGVGLDLRDPAAVRRFVEWLAEERRVAPSTQSQAGSALVFLFREVMRAGTVLDLPRPRGRRRLPAVLAPEEVRAVLAHLRGTHRLIGALLYGSGLRLGECLGLRLQDLSIDPPQITVRDGKGAKDRTTVLATFAVRALRRQMDRVAQVHRKDRARGGGWASLPGALHRKAPRDGWDLAWQYLFPGRGVVRDPASGHTGRGHVHPSSFQRAFKEAVRASGVPKRASPHTLRHSFATHAIQTGTDIRVLKEIMGHKSVKTTMIYLHVTDRSRLHLRSPLDHLMGS